jgi:hypothetical protein
MIQQSVRPPFGEGYGLLSFHVDDDAAELIRIFDVAWIG